MITSATGTVDTLTSTGNSELVQADPRPGTNARSAGYLPAALSDQQFTGPQFFALMDADDPNQVYYYGLDLGEQAFTVRTDPETGHTNFGSWRSMQSAFHRLESMTGGHVRMALVLFDSVPVMAMTALAQGSSTGSQAVEWQTAVPIIKAADIEPDASS